MPQLKMSTVIGAYLEGARRVVQAPAITIAACVALVLLAVPMRAVLQSDARVAGAVDVAAPAAPGWDWSAAWASRYGETGQRIASVLMHELLGFAGVVHVEATQLDRRPLPRSVVTALAAFWLLWTFLSGGILDRVARARPIRSAAFFAACGVHVWRFLRLGLIVAPLYWIVWAWLHPLLFAHPIDDMGRRLMMTATFLLALAMVNLVSDYARVRIVVEDRHSAVGAFGAAVRFIRRRPVRVLGLYVLSAVVAAVIVRLWAGAVPAGSGGSGWMFLATALYVVGRVWARLTWMAGEVVFFQGELAHASYVAAPMPVWPDSPAAEALDQLTRPRHTIGS